MRAKFWKAVYALIFLCLILLNGCSPQPEKPTPVTDFSADFTASYRDLIVKGSMSVSGRKLLLTRITEPETLGGLSASYEGNVLSLSRSDMCCTADEAYLPDDSFFSLLKATVAALSDSEQDAFVLTFDDKGMLTHAESTSLPFTLTLTAAP